MNCLEISPLVGWEAVMEERGLPALLYKVKAVQRRAYKHRHTGAGGCRPRVKFHLALS
jgi:hypothetical protein